MVGQNGLSADFTLTVDGQPPDPSIDPSHTVRLSNGNYQVRVTGVAGQSFIVQASSDSVHWITIRTDTLLANYLDFVDSTAVGHPQRYYRVLSLNTELNSMPLTLLTPTSQADGFFLHVAGTAGQPFRIQVSTNLLDWFDLTGGILRNETFDFSDPDAHRFNWRFYRTWKQ